jgi:ABC-type antimicrobial peptide transport system permease subunit
MILNYLQLGKDTKIIYIQNGQVFDDILWPGYYIYDSIYYIHELKKALYLNSGEVLLDKESAEMVEQELIRLGIDTNSIRVDSLKKDYDLLKGNLQLDLCESFFHLTINLLSFLLCVVSIVIIFLELRKKEFGVYKLIGKYPIKVIGKFVGLNGVITIGIALIVNPIFLFLLFIEGTIYGVLICKYMRSKAVLALKGE